MKYLSFDYETIPQPEEDLTAAQIKHWEKKKVALGTPGVTDTMIRSTDPFLGRILCAGMKYKDDTGDELVEEELAIFEGTEKDILIRFWEVISSVSRGTKIITFNGFNFDIPWSRIRSLANNITIPHLNINFFDVGTFSKYCPHVDIMVAIKGDKFIKNVSVGLDLACTTFGIPTPKDGIDGSQVYKFYLEGQLPKIADYVKRDASSTGLLYEKLINLGYIQE